MKSLKDFVKSLPCLVKNENCYGRTDAHHVKTRGSGGKEKNNLVPLCRAHHIYIHSCGKNTFSKRFNIDLEEIAKLIQNKYNNL